MGPSFLIQELKNGSEEAFILLVEKYSKSLFAYALSISDDWEMAQDIVQNVFMRTWEKRKKINISSSLHNYLLKSVQNEFMNIYKKRRSTMDLEQKYFESLEKAVRSYDEKTLKSALIRINEEIQKLPPKCKQVFLLSRKEGLTNIEISNYLQVSIKTVEAHISKAFTILRKNLDGKLTSILFILFETHLQSQKFSLNK
ncbi:RNA polymerase sigma factor [Flagellimonas onchidii]|uniref:RNA polymerase sigma factor n=1 Tax=Flagellimonas onchidii TaxID=2562684 RepID=UPI0010A5FE7C|nr:RNA polymerase sigma-70 factor [Allomuricauda onchidii]